MNKIYDNNLYQKNVYKEYVEQYDHSVQTGHDYIFNNDLQSLAFSSDKINQLLEIIYLNDSGLEEVHTDLILKYIGLPPIKWVKNSSYKIGDVVYLQDVLDSKIYICIRNIDVSVNVHNTDFWQETNNYYSTQSLQYLYQVWINRLKLITYPLWEPDKLYYKNDIVSTPEEYRALCITTNLNGTTNDLTTEDWLIFDLTGSDGTLSLGVSYKGDWIEGTTYSAKDMVRYVQGSKQILYIARNNIISSSPPEEGDQWMKVVETVSSRIDVLDTYPSDLNTVSDIFIVINSVKTENRSTANKVTWYSKINGEVSILYPEAKISKVNVTSLKRNLAQVASTTLNAQLNMLFYSLNLNKIYCEHIPDFWYPQIP